MQDTKDISGNIEIKDGIWRDLISYSIREEYAERLTYVVALDVEIILMSSTFLIYGE